MEEQQFTEKFARDRFRQWHFWWLVVFSLLLIITFVYYLPTRFLQQFNMEMEEVGHGHDELSEADDHNHEDGGMMENMHEHMDEHMGGMNMEEMMDHMMEEHEMTHEEAEGMMDEMMSHEHEGESADHDHGTDTTATTTGDNQAVSSIINYYEEADVKSGLAINLNITPVSYNTGTQLRMDFLVNEKPGNLSVPVSKLQIENEKLMHVVGVRSDMNEFFHIHPQPATGQEGVFTVNYSFSRPGSYKIWSDIKKDGEIYLFGHPEVSVNGAGAKEEKKVSFDRNVIVGPHYAEGSGEARNYQVSMISGDTIVQNREVDLSFDIHTLSGLEVDVENYLGVKMHLVLIKDDLSRFVHTHPVGHEHGYNNDFIDTASADEGHDRAEDTTGTVSGGDEVISFAVTLPEAGLYKAFAQFRPEGTDMPIDDYLLAEFWIQVEEKAPFPVSQWWGLLLVSVLLIAGLSWVVNNYLRVKPEDVSLKKN